jgi:hypothetical protein
MQRPTRHSRASINFSKLGTLPDIGHEYKVDTRGLAKCLTSGRQKRWAFPILIYLPHLGRGHGVGDALRFGGRQADLMIPRLLRADRPAKDAPCARGAIQVRQRNSCHRTARRFACGVEASRVQSFYPLPPVTMTNSLLLRAEARAAETKADHCASRSGPQRCSMGILQP